MVSGLNWIYAKTDFSLKQPGTTRSSGKLTATSLEALGKLSLAALVSGMEMMDVIKGVTRKKDAWTTSAMISNPSRPSKTARVT